MQKISKIEKTQISGGSISLIIAIIGVVFTAASITLSILNGVNKVEAAKKQKPITHTNSSFFRSYQTKNN